MTYKVTITSTDGQKYVYRCGGSTDQEALIYAGKVVEEKADESDPSASVTVTRDEQTIGPTVAVSDMIKRGARRG